MRNLWSWKERNLGSENAIGKCSRIGAGIFVLGLTVLVPAVAFGSVESSLVAVQAKLVGTLLPLAAICGLAFAGMSFVAGHANARAHLIWAIVGAVVGFGAESIVSLIRSVIQ